MMEHNLFVFLTSAFASAVTVLVAYSIIENKRRLERQVQNCRFIELTLIDCGGKIYVNMSNVDLFYNNPGSNEELSHTVIQFSEDYAIKVIQPTDYIVHLMSRG